MSKLLLTLVGLAAMGWAAALLVPRAEAAVPPTSIRTAVGETSAVEPAGCWRRRACGPRGCVWRTVCRRW